MHVVYLSQQSRLTLLNMLTQFIRKFSTGFHLLLLPKNVHSRNSTNEKSLIFRLLLPCILEIQQMKIFVFSQTRNDFFLTVPYWLPDYDGVSKK